MECLKNSYFNNFFKYFFNTISKKDCLCVTHVYSNFVKILKIPFLRLLKQQQVIPTKKFKEKKVLNKMNKGKNAAV